jgi:tRNA threonylcarbamoyladenosine biosynthesis protein TsaB
VLALGIETSTPQTTVALGSEQGLVASALLSAGRANHEAVIPAIQHLLEWSGVRLAAVGGIAVSLGPGLFTGMRVGLATAKTLSQTLAVPIIGLASLDILAFGARYSRRMICVAIDAKRNEVFYAFYRPVPGGVTRTTSFEVGSADRLAGELVAHPEDMLVLGTGALTYRRALEEAGGHVEIASPAYAHPQAGALVELAIPRFLREEHDRLYDLQPIYVRRSDAEIAWDQRRRTG